MNEEDKIFFGRLDEIINSDNIQEIINERLKYLNSEEYKRECVVDRNQYDIVTLIKGHISPNVRVDFSAGVTENGYMYDDDSIYIDFLNNIKNCVETSGVKAKSSIVKALKKSVLEYFGDTFDEKMFECYKSLDDAREHYPIDLVMKWCEENNIDFLKRPDDIQISISKIKGLGISMCSERAALVQQLLTFIGAECYYVACECRLEDNDKEQGHAYNVMRSEKGIFIIDLTNDNVGQVFENLDDVIYAKKRIKAGKYSYGEPTEKQKSKNNIDDMFDDM